MLASWLEQASLARAAWEDVRTEAERLGPAVLPQADAVAAHAAIDAADASFSLWHFAAQYAALVQIFGSVRNADTVIADGRGRLAAYCAAGAMSITEALRALYETPPAFSNATAPSFRVRCESAAGVNVPLPADAAMRDAEWWQRRVAELETAAGSELLKIDFSGASAFEFGRFFAALAVNHALDWPTLARNELPFVRSPGYAWQREAYWLPRPELTANDVAPAAPVAAAADETPGFNRTALLALPAAAREPRLVEYLTERVATALHMAAVDLDATRPLNKLGIDSLTALEVKNRIERDFDVKVPIVKFLDGYSVLDFAQHLLGELASGVVTKANTDVVITAPASVMQGVPAASRNVSAIESRIAEMSSDEVDALLMELVQQGTSQWNSPSLHNHLPA
jgi:acyl carrier protein